MPHRHDLYGFEDLTLEEAKAHVEEALGITLELRDSMYAGLYYRGKDGRGRSFHLSENDKDYYHRPEYEEYGVILSVGDVEVSDEIERKLLGGGRAILLRSKVYPDDDEYEGGIWGMTEVSDPSLPHQRYDLYGFKTMDLEEAKRFVEGALGITFEWDKSSIWGSGGFYCVRNGEVWDYILYRNVGDKPEHPRYREYGVILSVDHVPDMDEIQRKLTEGRAEPKHLRTQRIEVFGDDE
jgi:hypothetical protein